MKKDSLISLTSKGFYCRQGDFYIDPWKPVDRAVITHAHADHAYRGSRNYLVTEEGLRLYRIRLGDEANISTQRYGDPVEMNGVKVSFHPAGHVLGSAQVRVEYKGEVWVVSGDYKLMPDATCDAVRTGQVSSFHHRSDIWPADLPMAADAIHFRRDKHMVAAEPGKGEGIGPVRLFARKSAACNERHRPFDRADLHSRCRRTPDSGLPRARRGYARDDLRRCGRE